MTFQPKKLSLVGIALLFASVALIFLSKITVNQVAFNVFLHSQFESVTALNAFTSAAAVVGYALVAVGACIFVYVGWRSHFVVDAPTVKRQLRVLIVAAAVLLVTLSLFSTEVASANSLATTGYYLATPYSPYDWLIGNFSSGQYYAINGSNWANMMTWPTPAPWADYAGNSTQVVEAALGATTQGVVYLKEVPFDLALMNSIPENVKVACSYQDQYEEFINPLDTTGSPYQIEVGQGVTVDNYIARDSQNRICFTSINADDVARNVSAIMTSGDILQFTDGLFTFNTPYQYESSFYLGLGLPTNTWLRGNGNSTIIKWADNIVDPNPTTGAVCLIGNAHPNSGNYGITISDLTLDGNAANQPEKGGNWENINLKNTTDFTIRQVVNLNANSDGVDFDQCTRGLVESCWAYNSLKCSYHASTDTSWVTFRNCFSNGTYGVADSNQGDGFSTVNSAAYITYDHCISINDMVGFRIDGSLIKLDECTVFQPLKSAIRSVQNAYSAEINGGLYTRTVTYDTRSYFLKFSNSYGGTPVIANVNIKGATIRVTDAITTAVNDRLIMNLTSGEISNCIISGACRTLMMSPAATSIQFEHNSVNAGAFYPIDLNSVPSSTVRFNNFTSTASHPWVRNFGSTCKIVEYNTGYVTEKTFSATVANDEWVAHGLVDAPSSGSVTARTTVYEGQPVIVGWKSQNATHCQISAYYLNGTAIIADAIQVGCTWKYVP